MSPWPEPGISSLGASLFLFVPGSERVACTRTVIQRYTETFERGARERGDASITPIPPARHEFSDAYVANNRGHFALVSWYDRIEK